MRIAVAAEEDRISQHFGHCGSFYLVDVEGKEVVGKKVLASPAHQPGFLPGFLKTYGVDMVIAGGMGANAQLAFKEMNIDVIVGARGTVDEVVAEYINGRLLSTNSVCSEHEHGGGCGGH